MRRHRCVALAAVSFLCLAPRAALAGEAGLPLAEPRSISSALAGPAGWASGFGWPGTHGTPYAVASYRGELIVAGEFSEIGGVGAGMIARWDGIAWQPLGGGLRQTDLSTRGLVTSMTVYQGDLVVVGGFDLADGVSVSNVARWDGTSWHPMGDGFDSGSQAVIVHQGVLIAAGEFSHSGATSAPHIAYWDGSAWQALSGGGLNGMAIALASYHDELVAAGSFSLAGGAAVNNIAAWNGTQWHALAGGLTGGFQGLVYDLAVFGDSLIVGGAFDHAGTIAAGGIAAWDGAAWRTLGAGFDAYVYALTVFENRLIAGGNFLSSGGQPVEGIAAWDGSAWAPLASRTGRIGAPTEPPTYLTLGVFDTLLVAGGHFDMTPDVLAVGVAGWDGARWLPFGSGLSDDYYVSWVSCFASYDGRMIVGGRLAHAQNSPLASVDLRAWDGSEMDVFEPFVSAPSTPEVSALAVYRGDLIAAGTFTQIGGAPVSFIARWAGQAWQALGSGTDGPVDALVVRGDTLFAGGIFAMAGGVAAANVAYWDGAHWGALGAGTNGAVDVLLAYGDDLVAGGLFTRAGVVTASHVAVWSGGAWRALGQGTDDWVRAAATYGGALVVGGHFMHAGGVAANHVARWNGAAWGALDLGLDDDVSALAAFGPDLIAGGRFQFAGGLPAKRIASWDGGAWHPLEGGLEATGYPISANVLALDPVGGSLYVGGFFVTAGGFPSYNIARWDSLRVVVPPRVTELSPNVPNPFSVTTRFTIQLASAGHVRFAIYDASGRRIAVLVDGDRPAGPQQVEWDGRDARRAHAPMGVYFARFEAAGVTRTRKVVLAR